MERLEDVVRTGESPDEFTLLLRGGEDTEEKLRRQAAVLESRFTFGGAPARGISLFAARGDLEVREVLGTKLRTYPRYRRLEARALSEILVLLPTFATPHWTALFQPPRSPGQSEEHLLADLIAILGPVLDNPKYLPARRRRR